MSRGGKRKGAGRPRGKVIPESLRRKKFSIRIPAYLIRLLKMASINRQLSQGKIVERALKKYLGL